MPTAARSLQLFVVPVFLAGPPDYEVIAGAILETCETLTRLCQAVGSTNLTIFPRIAIFCMD